MKKFPIALISGIALMIVTGLAFFMILQDASLKLIHFLAIGGVILSELIATIYAASSQGRPRKVAAASVSAIAVPASIVLAYIYLKYNPKAVVSFVCWYSAVLVLVNALAVILLGLDGDKKTQNVQLQDAKGNMLRLRQQVQSIAAIKASQPYAARLQKLDEDLRFSNDAVIAAEDASIDQLLAQLQSCIINQNSDVEMTLTQLEQLVQRRTIQNRYSK